MNRQHQPPGVTKPIYPLTQGSGRISICVPWSLQGVFSFVAFQGTWALWQETMHIPNWAGNGCLDQTIKKYKRQGQNQPFTLASLALLEPFPSVFFCLEEELLLLPLLLSLPGLLLDFRDEDWLTVLFLELCSCLESFCRAGAAGEGSKSFSLTALGFEDLEKRNKFRVWVSSLTNKTKIKTNKNNSKKTKLWFLNL